MAARRRGISRIDRAHGRQSCSHHTAACTSRPSDGRDRAAGTAIVSSGAGILGRCPAHALGKALPFYSAMRLRYRFAHFRFNLVGFYDLSARLLGNVHRAATQDSTAACAGAQFCKSHFYRHRTEPRSFMHAIKLGLRACIQTYPADKTGSRKSVNPV